MGRKKLESRTTDAAAVVSYKHKDKRKRIPTQEESVKLSAREKQPVKKRYDYDPSLDPQLIWAGKKEAGVELPISTVPIYVQEKVAPEAIIARLKQGAKDEMQLTLFGETTQQQFDKAVEFYKHEDNWQNRMVLGDSLLTMNSLLEKEGMRGKVQTIYIDPPYGIKFGSNWQVSTRKRDVKDNKIEDFIRQPEQIKAFRDTWELGVHSYLTYLRDRLIVTRELLTETGCCFVQISDENVHLVRSVMDEVFGSNNFVAIINFRRKISVMNPKYLGTVNDYLLFYAKDIKNLKFRRLFLKTPPFLGETWSHVELTTGERRRLTPEEINNPNILPKGAKVFTSYKLAPAGFNSSSVFNFNYEGKSYKPPLTGGQRSWKTTLAGMESLAKKR
ncbi:site-specific DNA-methyltransferase, partial [Candidatus Microgenomates bacterium]|nr:site-specific DNA-methyltransferase [Candidatus Microgenomates bacterium]